MSSPKAILSMIAWALALFAIGVLLGLWIADQPSAPVGSAVEAKADPALKRIATETIPCAPVKVHTASAKKKLSLPAEVQDNQNQQVTASIRLPADLYPHRITSVADLDTGETRVYNQRLERPWLAINPRGYVGVGYGQNQDGRAIRLAVSKSAVDIKNLTVTGDASFDYSLGNARNSWFAGLMVKREF